MKSTPSGYIVTASPLPGEDTTNETSAPVTQDVAEHDRHGDEVNRAHSLELIGLLAGGLSHDFNNMLNIINGNITFARMLAEGNAAIVEPLADAEEACERAKKLGIRLQAFAEVSLPVKTPLDVVSVIEDIAGAMFDGTAISHFISVAEGIFPVEGDPEQIRRVFESLLTNAREAMPGGGEVRIDIENFAVSDVYKGLPLRSGLYVCIALQDDGNGIPEENLPKIFDPCFSTKEACGQRGVGLGLPVCSTILKRHKGHITVESGMGTGTRVTVYLPASVEEISLRQRE